MRVMSCDVARKILLFAVLIPPAVLMAGGCQSQSSPPPVPQPYLVFRGAGDASAAAALDETSFGLADDEDSRLRIYRLDAPGQPIATVDLTRFLGIAPNDSETDLEAAAVIGNRVYWVSSHDTTKRGVTQVGRDYFFATEVIREGGVTTLWPTGTPCRGLISRLLESTVLQSLERDDGAASSETGKGKKKHKKKHDGPADQGFKIEGMCASPDGHRLYLGFRQPRLTSPDNKPDQALVIPIENPAQIVDEQATPAFGTPLPWDLGGRAIRGMDCSSANKTIYIVAGPEKEDGPASALYRWDGEPASQPVLVRTFGEEGNGLTPESVVVFPRTNQCLIISDDGDVRIDTSNDSPASFGNGSTRNKDLHDPLLKRFRAFWVDPESRPGA